MSSFIARVVRSFALTTSVVGCLCAAVAQPIKSPADWDAQMTGRFGTKLPVVGEKWLPEGDNYAWQAARFVEGYLSLAKLTGERRYMDSSKEILDYMLSNRDDVRFAGKPMEAPYHYAPTTYMFHRGTPAQGWRRKSGPAMGVSVLIDGRICEMFIQWCEVARQGFPEIYEPDITRYLARVHETIEQHQPAFFTVIKVDPVKVTYHATLPAGGFRHWWHVNEMTLPTSEAPRTYSGQIPLNHSCTMARAMLGYDRLTGTKTYRDKVQLVVNFYLNSLDPKITDRAIWEYDPARKDRFDTEDVGHASIDLSLVEAAYRAGGYGIDDKLVERLVKTFHGFYDDTTKDVYFKIDGPVNPSVKPRKDYGDRSSIGFASWLWLAQRDPSIAAKVRATYETFFVNDTSGFVMGGWGNLLYAEGLIAGKVKVAPAKVGSPAPKAVN